MTRALEKHFPDGPLSAGNARVAFYRWSNAPKGRPVDLLAYRWLRCEDQICQNLEIARSADITVAEFEGWQTSFAAYLPERRPQDDLLQQFEQRAAGIDFNKDLERE